LFCHIYGLRAPIGATDNACLRRFLGDLIENRNNRTIFLLLLPALELDWRGVVEQLTQAEFVLLHSSGLGY